MTRKERSARYYKTPGGRKAWRKNNWKRIGVIHNNYDELYEKYMNTINCELCSVALTEDKKRKSTTRCLDHDHKTGKVRNIVCHRCNIRREILMPLKEYRKLYMRENRFWKKYNDIISEFIMMMNEY